MKTRCKYCHAYRIEEDKHRHLELAHGLPCFECQDWVEEEFEDDEWEPEEDDEVYAGI
jgi:hypothetical protein